jgi:hypothetical protein
MREIPKENRLRLIIEEVNKLDSESSSYLVEAENIETLAQVVTLLGAALGTVFRKDDPPSVVMAALSHLFLIATEGHGTRQWAPKDFSREFDA